MKLGGEVPRTGNVRGFLPFAAGTLLAARKHRAVSFMSICSIIKLMLIARPFSARANVQRTQEYDRRQAALSVSQAEVTQAMADVHQVRVSLGLEAQPSSGDLGEVPPDLDQTFSSVREAQAALIQTAAQLGVVQSYVQLPKQMIEQFENLDQGDVDRTLAGLTANAPAVKQAQAKLEIANRDLVQAELNLRYCDIVAEIDGVVTRRNVNPGNNVHVRCSIRLLEQAADRARYREVFTSL
jgi:membrane fusion protein (multidrug efflux system)